MVLTMKQIRDHLKVDTNDSDTELARLALVAEAYVGQYLERDIPWSTDTESEVMPEPVKHAMLLIIGDLWENREAQSILNNNAKYESNPTVDRLLTFYRDGMGV